MSEKRDTKPTAGDRPSKYEQVFGIMALLALKSPEAVERDWGISGYAWHGQVAFSPQGPAFDVLVQTVRGPNLAHASNPAVRMALGAAEILFEPGDAVVIPKPQLDALVALNLELRRVQLHTGRLQADDEARERIRSRRIPRGTELYIPDMPDGDYSGFEGEADKNPMTKMLSRCVISVHDDGSAVVIHKSGKPIWALQPDYAAPTE